MDLSRRGPLDGGVAAATAGSAWVMQGFFDAVAHPEDRWSIWLVAIEIALIFLARGVFTYLQTVLLAVAATVRGAAAIADSCQADAAGCGLLFGTIPPRSSCA